MPLNAKILNIGCGNEYEDDAVNLDNDPKVKADVYRDLRRGLPFADNRFDRISAFHILEHIRDYEDLCFIMKECYRVLTNGGILEVRVPPWNAENAYSDPTHERFFTPRSFDIFCGENGKWGVPQGLEDLNFTKIFFERRRIANEPVGIDEFVCLLQANKLE